MEKTMDGIVKKEFVIYFYDRELELLNKFNFKEEICEDEFIQDEKYIITDLKQKGVIYSFYVNDKNYYQGTTIYQQLINI